jgi:nucleoid-associated protein YgaU
MKRLTWTTALAGAALLALVAGSPAHAQNAEPAAPAAPASAAPAAAPAEAAPAPKKAKAKKASSASTVAVSVWNSRSTDLTELQVAESGSASFKKVLGKLKAGKKIGVTVPKSKDCQIDLHATFADGQTTEASGVDVCTQKILNLTE